MLSTAILRFTFTLPYLQVQQSQHSGAKRDYLAGHADESAEVHAGRLVAADFALARARSRSADVTQAQRCQGVGLGRRAGPLQQLDRVREAEIGGGGGDGSHVWVGRVEAGGRVDRAADAAAAAVVAVQPVRQERRRRRTRVVDRRRHPRVTRRNAAARRNAHRRRLLLDDVVAVGAGAEVDDVDERRHRRRAARVMMELARVHCAVHTDTNNQHYHQAMNSPCSASCVSCKRATARICCCAPCCSLVLLRHRTCRNRLVSPAHLSTRRTLLRRTNGTDGRWLVGVEFNAPLDII